MRAISSIIITIASALLLGCNGKHKAEDVAAKTACLYYQQLIDGHYDAFVDGHYQPEAIPKVYRQQLIDNAKMFIEQQRTERKGLYKVAVAATATDSAGMLANVHLSLKFRDSTTEVIVVPMIKHNNIWYMR